MQTNSFRSYLHTVSSLFLGAHARPCGSVHAAPQQRVQPSPRPRHKSRHPSKQGLKPHPEPWLESDPSAWWTLPAKHSHPPQHTQQQDAQHSKLPNPAPHGPSPKERQRHKAGPQPSKSSAPPSSQQVSTAALSFAEPPAAAQQQAKPTGSRQLRRSTRGRYLHSTSPSASLASETQHARPDPTQALRAASALAALAGPDVRIAGPRILGRQRPVHKRVTLFGQQGRSADPWWRWRQWLLCKQKVAADAAARRTQQAELAQDTAGGQGSVTVPRMTSLYADEGDLDLDAVDEATTPKGLWNVGSRQALVDHLCLRMLSDLRGLASQHKRQQQQHQHQQQQRAHMKHTEAADRQRLAPALRQQQQQQQQLQQLPSLGIFKGGGYVAADLEYMLQQTGLAPALRLQHTLEGAGCILAKQRWRSGKHVDLRQQAAASRKRGIPLVFTPSLKTRDLLWALRPVLLDQGLVSDSRARAKAEGRKVICLTRSTSRSAEAGGTTSSWDDEVAETGDGASWGAQGDSVQPADTQAQEGEDTGCWDGMEECQRQLLEGSISVCEYICLSRVR